METYEKVLVQVECAKEVKELIDGITGLVKDVQEALADGWQPAQDVPVILTKAVARFGTAVEGITKIKGELSNDRKAFVMGVVIPVSELVEALTK